MVKSAEFSIPFDEIKDSILGKHYELSLVFADKRTSRRLNRTFRGKDKATNVLSFPLSENSGEIFIDLSTAKDEASKFDMSFEDFVLYLFIHGVLHLSGLEHGSTMDKEESKFLNKFKGHGTPSSNRHRHRNQHHKGGDIGGAGRKIPKRRI